MIVYLATNNPHKVEELAPDAPFDLVFSNAALHWMTRPDAVIARVRDALVPGGALQERGLTPADGPPALAAHPFWFAGSHPSGQH